MLMITVDASKDQLSSNNHSLFLITNNFKYLYRIGEFYYVKTARTIQIIKASYLFLPNLWHNQHDCASDGVCRRTQKQ